MHADWYHGRRLHEVTRAGWGEEEMVLVAREENRPVRHGIALAGGSLCRVRVNEDLHAAFPHRTLDAIKRLRKSTKYRDLRERLRNEEELKLRLSAETEPAEDPTDHEHELPWMSRRGVVIDEVLYVRREGRLTPTRHTNKGGDDITMVR
ncbi:MAG: hypothetical protein M3H12_06185 [Chromatiales bacterium]